MAHTSLFVGRKAKQIALREIYPCNIRKGTNEGIITLRSETRSIHTEHPLFFAESDPFKPIITQSEPHAYCHYTSSIPLQWTKSIPNDLFDIIHARLFGLFIDVLCKTASHHDIRPLYYSSSLEVSELPRSPG